MSRYRALRGIASPALGVVATQKDALAEATHDELVEVVQRAQLLAIQLELSRISHRRIGIATGIVMGLQRLPEKDAFELLRRASMNLNEKLVEVAEHVIDTGLLPTSSRDQARVPTKAHGEVMDQPDPSNPRAPEAKESGWRAGFEPGANGLDCLECGARVGVRPELTRRHRRWHQELRSYMTPTD